jgi:hypothetical protein
MPADGSPPDISATGRLVCDGVKVYELPGPPMRPVDLDEPATIGGSARPPQGLRRGSGS